MLSLSSTSSSARHERRLTVLRELVLFAGVSLAAAQVLAQVEPGTACDEPRLRIEGSLSPHWLAPVVELCDTLGSMADLDRSAQLRVVAAGQDVIVEVTLADGRSTLRRVHVPADLPLTVEALVSVPPLPLVTPAPAPALAAASPQPVAVSRPFQLDPELRPVPPPRRLNVEVGSSAVGRVAGAARYLSVGLTAYAGLHTGPWLLALTARWDGFQTVVDDRPRDFEMTTAGGGFLLLREVASSDTLALQLGVDTWLLGETQAYTPVDRELAGSTVDTRVGLLARALFGTGALRYLASLDAELSLGRLRHRLYIDDELPALPAWSLGLGLGVAWEAQ